MRKSWFPKRSLRVNLILGITAMLLPWVMFILVEGQFLFPRTVGAFEDVVKQTGSRMRAVMELHESVQRAAMHTNEYLIDPDPARREAFIRVSHRLDESFEKVRGNYTDLPRLQQQIDAAREAWQQAGDIATRILKLSPPIDYAAVAPAFQRMNSLIDETHSHLDRIHDVVREQAGRQLDDARAASRQVRLLNAGIFVVAMIMAAISGFGLARSILVPLRSLEESASRLGAGDLEHRVEIEGDSEIQQLAGAFNTMAERLQYTQVTLEETAARDGLTGLFNQKEFLRRLDIEIGRQQRYGRPFSLLMLDLDYFKRINDLHGHQAGDEVLRTIARRIQVELRPTDLVARYGGEEFVIILAETLGADALVVAERICVAVDCCAIEIPGDRTITMTASIGVAAYPEDADSSDRIITAADKALYSAKAAGRNRVARYNSHTAGQHSEA